MHILKNAIKKTVGRYFRLLLPFYLHKSVRVIFAYHHVFEHPPEAFYDPAMYVLARSLEMHVKEMAKFFRIVPLQQLLEKTDEPENLCTITFDDGFRDMYDTAYPILTRYKLPATVFLTVSGVDRAARFWFDDLFILATLSTKRCQESAFIGYWQSIVPSWRPKRITAQNVSMLVEYLKAMKGNIQDSMVKDAFDCIGLNRPMDRVTLDWSQIREMERHGMTFASHGLDHVLLTQVDTVLKKKNISESIGIMRNRCINPILVFSYPNGDWDQEVIFLLKNAGYTGAVTTVSGRIKDHHSFTLPRVGLHEGMSNTSELFWFAFFQAVFP